MNTHPYSPDTSAPDWKGRPRQCVVCELPERNKVHRDTAGEDLSDRIVGEKRYGTTESAYDGKRSDETLATPAGPDRITLT